MHQLRTHIGRRIAIQHRTVEITGVRLLGQKQYFVVKDATGTETLIAPRVLLRSALDRSKLQ